MAGKGLWWEDYLAQVLSTKPAEVVEEACQVLEKHGCRVEEKLKSELYYSSTLCHTHTHTRTHTHTTHTQTHTHTHTCTDHTCTHYVYLGGINAFWPGGLYESSISGPSGYFYKGNVHCVQLKGKTHPFTIVVLTQIIKAFVGRPGNTLEETCTIGGRQLLSTQCTLIPLW